MSGAPLSEAGRELLQSMRDAMVRLLSRRAGPHLHDTLGDLAEEVRGVRRRIDDAEHDGREQIEAGIRRLDPPMAHEGRAGDRHGVPDNVTGLLARIHASGVDPGTATRVERAVLDRYQQQLQVRERTLRQEFLNNRSRELRDRGETADAAETTARSQVDDYLRSERAQHLISRDAAARTTEWADNIELAPVLREIATSPRTRAGSVDDALARLTSRAEQDTSLPKGLKQALARLENSGADPRAVDRATRLLHERYHEYRQQPMANTYRETLLERRAEFTRDGFPPHVADRLAQRDTEAFTQTPKAQRMIDSVAANNTNQWLEKMRGAADRAGVDIADRLAEIHRYEHQPVPEPELRAARDRLDAMHADLDTTQHRLNTLLERSPELADKGAARWQEGIDALRDNISRLSETVRAGTTGGETVTRRTINDAALQGREANLRGYDGEIRMAAKLDDIHDLGPLVDVSTPTGTRMASEVDIVTEQGRTWHEVKTNDPDAQRSSQKELEAQARKQLAISHMNREYWVDGKPPELKMHFMNGVHPTVKSRIEAIRIEDENGHIIDNHRVEVIDES
ncbi:hypothetical protein [Nocardia brevicatena]|uniref:hypothetical protein n=1 Tax=Nocardia brevicatena TaxID=37327 RepID=UPI000595005D|nr:hypothetical protein [Nocardia brevicatena]